MLFFSDDSPEAESSARDQATELSTIRSELMLTQLELAEELGVSRNYIAQIEMGRRQGRKLIERARELLGAEVEHSDEERAAYQEQIANIIASMHGGPNG